MYKNKFKVGDKVLIATKRGLPKEGRVGTIRRICVAGYLVTFADHEESAGVYYTAEHLRKFFSQDDQVTHKGEKLQVAGTGNWPDGYYELREPNTGRGVLGWCDNMSLIPSTYPDDTWKYGEDFDDEPLNEITDRPFPDPPLGPLECPAAVEPLNCVP